MLSCRLTVSILTRETLEEKDGRDSGVRARTARRGSCDGRDGPSVGARRCEDATRGSHRRRPGVHSVLAAAYRHAAAGGAARQRRPRAGAGGRRAGAHRRWAPRWWRRPDACAGRSGRPAAALAVPSTARPDVGRTAGRATGRPVCRRRRRRRGGRQRQPGDPRRVPPAGVRAPRRRAGRRGAVASRPSRARTGRRWRLLPRRSGSPNMGGAWRRDR